MNILYHCNMRQQIFDYIFFWDTVVKYGKYILREIIMIKPYPNIDKIKPLHLKKPSSSTCCLLVIVNDYFVLYVANYWQKGLILIWIIVDNKWLKVIPELQVNIQLRIKNSLDMFLVFLLVFWIPLISFCLILIALFWMLYNSSIIIEQVTLIPVVTCIAFYMFFVLNLVEESINKIPSWLLRNHNP